MPINRPNLYVRTKQVVINKHTTDPFVGYENTNNLPDGFLYDIKRWCSTFDLRLPTLPRLTDSEPQGIDASKYFLSGVGDVEQGDLEVLEFNELIGGNERHWIPLIRSGHYYHYNIPFYYYSDDSRIQYIDSLENVDNRNVILLDNEPHQNTPITAATYVRNIQSRSVDYLFRIEQKYIFSGTYTDGIEDKTVTELGKINWDNVNYNKKEFIVDNTNTDKTYLMFNKDYIQHFGVTPVVAQDLAACEVLGISNGSSYQTFYLRHFPIIPSSFKLYITDGTTWTEWTRASTWFDLINGVVTSGINRYYIDKDLGILYFGSAQENSNPLIGEYIVCQYDTTVRVEYEEEGDDLLLSAWNADISTLTQYVNQGFVCITHQELEPAYITLSIDKQPIPFTSSPRLYGPVFIGSDFSLLKATVTSYDGTPVPGVEVTFSVDPSNTGYLEGASTSTGLTNGKGEAFTYYQSPTSADDLGYYLTNVVGKDPYVRDSVHPSYLNHKDVIIPSKLANLLGQEEQLYIYQILKDDLLLGYDNVDDWIDANLTPPPWVTDANTDAQWKREVSEEYSLKDWFEVNTSAGIKSDGTIDGRKVVIYKLDPSTDNFDSNAIDPSIDTTQDPAPTGAIVPVRPELIEVIDLVGDPYYGHTRLIYPKDAIPDPEPANSSNNVGGYWAVSSKVIAFQAKCWSPMYNRDIYSNKISTRISLPDYLLGEYINEQLQKIPFGWKLLTETDNVAAGLNGATFLTVNPHTGPYKILDLVSGTINDDWASAPFKSIVFQVDV